MNAPRYAYVRLRVYKAGRGAPLEWYFDSQDQHEKAREVCSEQGARIFVTHFGDRVPEGDFITDAEELRAYLAGEA